MSDCRDKYEYPPLDSHLTGPFSGWVGFFLAIAALVSSGTELPALHRILEK